jgi:hypothetical protein
VAIVIRRAALWVLAALAGLALAAGVTYSAGRLSTQRIGLSSEPLSAGDELAPRTTATPRRALTAAPTRTRTRTPTPAATAVKDDGEGDD